MEAPERRRGIWISFHLAAISVAAGFVSVSCDDGAASDPSVVFDTVGTVIHVRNPAAHDRSAEEVPSAGEVLLRLGTAEGGSPASFGRIGGLDVAEDGRVYVADAQALEVRVFSRDGDFLFAFGREGEGPGEFRAVDGLVLEPGGSIVVRDPRLSRASRFAPDGTYLESHSLHRSFMQFSHGTTLWVDGNGRLFDQVVLSTTVGEPDRIAVLVHAPDRARVDTVLVAEHESPTLLAVRDGRPVGALTAPFAARPFVAVDPAARIASGIGDVYRIEVRDAGGGLRRVITLDRTEAPVRSEEWRAAEEALRLRAGRMFPGARLGDVQPPERRPVIARLLSDDRGRWWVGRYRADEDPEDPAASFPTRYDVLDPEGRHLQTVELPPLRLFRIHGGFLAGVEVDALGVERVVVLGLE